MTRTWISAFEIHTQFWGRLPGKDTALSAGSKPVTSQFAGLGDFHQECVRFGAKVCRSHPVGGAAFVRPIHSSLQLSVRIVSSACWSRYRVILMLRRPWRGPINTMSPATTGTKRAERSPSGIRLAPIEVEKGTKR